MSSAGERRRGQWGIATGEKCRAGAVILPADTDLRHRLPATSAPEQIRADFSMFLDSDNLPIRSLRLSPVAVFLSFFIDVCGRGILNVTVSAPSTAFPLQRRTAAEAASRTWVSTPRKRSGNEKSHG